MLGNLLGTDNSRSPAAKNSNVTSSGAAPPVPAFPLKVELSTATLVSEGHKDGLFITSHLTSAGTLGPAGLQDLGSSLLSQLQHRKKMKLFPGVRFTSDPQSKVLFSVGNRLHNVLIMGPISGTRSLKKKTRRCSVRRRNGSIYRRALFSEARSVLCLWTGVVRK